MCIFFAGVDYHFHRGEIYLTLSNGSIQCYKVSIVEKGTGELNITLLNEPPTIVYTTLGDNTLGNITVDWLNNNIYWIEFEGSTTKVHVHLYALLLEVPIHLCSCM